MLNKQNLKIWSVLVVILVAVTVAILVIINNQKDKDKEDDQNQTQTEEVQNNIQDAPESGNGSLTDEEINKPEEINPPILEVDGDL